MSDAYLDNIHYIYMLNQIQALQWWLIRDCY